MKKSTFVRTKTIGSANKRPKHWSTRITAWQLYASSQHAVGGQSVQCGLEERGAGVCSSAGYFVV